MNGLKLRHGSGASQAITVDKLNHDARLWGWRWHWRETTHHCTGYVLPVLKHHSFRSSSGRKGYSAHKTSRRKRSIQVPKIKSTTAVTMVMPPCSSSDLHINVAIKLASNKLFLHIHGQVLNIKLYRRWFWARYCKPADTAIVFIAVHRVYNIDVSQGFQFLAHNIYHTNLSIYV
jgi:hypothetical protein